jgi:cyanophycin synthetase
LDSIIPKNKKLFVRKNANLSTWGVSIDITDQIHPEIKRMAEQASKILWLYVCGIDYLSKDITKPLKQQHWWIIEVNHTPWLRWHHFPAIGKPRNVAKEILKIAFK